jgi:hypothetical protein
MHVGLFLMKLWVISGACRNVGKTWLSRKLTEMLPEAVYAKIGHSAKSEYKQSNYFTSTADFFDYMATLESYQHCFVESNTLMRKKQGDMRIFITANSSFKDIRTDIGQLRSAANIIIDENADENQWREQLNNIVSNCQAEKICQLLREQKNFIFKQID